MRLTVPMTSPFFKPQVNTQRLPVIYTFGGNFTADTDTLPLITASFLLLILFISCNPNLLSTIDWTRHGHVSKTGSIRNALPGFLNWDLEKANHFGFNSKQRKHKLKSCEVAISTEKLQNPT